MNEVNEKRSGSTDPTACSAADGTQLPINAGRSSDELRLALASAIAVQKRARQVYDEALQEYLEAYTRYGRARSRLLDACENADCIRDLIARNEHSVTDGR